MTTWSPLMVVWGFVLEKCSLELEQDYCCHGGLATRLRREVADKGSA